MGDDKGDWQMKAIKKSCDNCSMDYCLRDGRKDHHGDDWVLNKQNSCIKSNLAQWEPDSDTNTEISIEDSKEIDQLKINLEKAIKALEYYAGHEDYYLAEETLKEIRGES